MSVIHICSLKMVESLAAEIKPTHVLSLLAGITPFPPTPHGIDPANHLKLTLADISEHEPGMILPASNHVADVIAFGRRWKEESGGTRPLLVHCFAGISRSSASALTIACAVRPDVKEAAYTKALRGVSAYCQPNSLIVRHADELLSREGRLIGAVADMGQGDFSKAGEPYVLRLDV